MNYERIPELDIISSYFDDGYVGTCIDIGASDGYHGSMSLKFELAGWDVLCVEPNPIYYSRCASIRENVSDYAVGSENEDGVSFTVYNVGGGNLSAISGLQTDERLVESHSHLIVDTYDIEVSVRTLDYIIEEQFSHVNNIDFVSIDVEGTELDVLHGFDIERWMPRLFVIENNFEEDHLLNYLSQFGYEKQTRHNVNDFYVRR